MDSNTLLAIAAIVIAVLARPLEMLWDKLFQTKLKTVKYKYNRLHVAYIFFALSFALAAFSIINLMLYRELDKRFILLMCLNFLNISFLASMITIHYHYRKLIKSEFKEIWTEIKKSHVEMKDVKTQC